MMGYLCYFTELLLKKEFIESKENESMHKNLNLVLDSFPEGVLIYEKATRKVLLANKNIVNLISS